MITINDYIKQLLKKKNWTLKQFANAINEVKQNAGITSKTTVQNISNFLNQVDDGHILRPKQLVLWEMALGVPYDSLCNFVEQPKSKNGIKELEKLKKRVRK